MRHQPDSDLASGDNAKNVSSGPFTTPCDRLALRRLEEAYESRQPLAVLTGNGQKSLRLIVDTFIDGLESDTEIVRIEEPFADALHCMRFIIQSIDFDPKNLNVNDLENIFRMFLSFQHTHHRRTVICLEGAQDFDWWTLDKMRRHVQREEREGRGLMIVLCGSADLNEMMYRSPLDSIADLGAEPIVLADCSLAETREYIRRQVETGTGVFIGDLFEYESATLIHELSGGVTDIIDDLCRKSLALASGEDGGPVTEELVNRVAKMLGLITETQTADTEQIDMLDGFDVTAGRRLVTRLNGHVVKDIVLDKHHVLIGADQVCDIRVSGRQVSQHHALIIVTPDGAKVADLGSINRTIISGRNASQHELINGDILEIGDYRIEYRDASGASADENSRTPIARAAAPLRFPSERLRR